ncbi:hypothetical protein G7Y89_g3933 [Cudoniella acicularis]|uniref:Heterokaryon incompatibility domain-containing protein n=1 Tax=Cudoniella acicularis TaxID=354080 RepID=A0A8H4W7X3_9HELO|nr:hypothetical protein G7Y89_g3933 [Cudoniella acicularis]
MDDPLQYSGYVYNKLDDQWIDLGVVQNWIKSCETHYADHCWTSSPISTTTFSGRPLWIIDVHNSCLVNVEAKNVRRYITLSYVWSHSPATSLTTNNLKKFREDQALTNESMPLAVSHAISLTKLLGEMYLWADRLCICQEGDEKAKFDQLKIMAEIYANSYFTIVATQGNNADNGLRGIFDVTPPRQLVRPLRYRDHYEAISIQAETLMSTNWHCRGWTF